MQIKTDSPEKQAFLMALKAKLKTYAAKRIIFICQLIILILAVFYLIIVNSILSVNPFVEILAVVLIVGVLLPFMVQQGNPLSQASRQARRLRALLEARTKFMLEHAPLGFALSDYEGKLVQVNAYLCELLGYSEAEMVNRRFKEFLHPDEPAIPKELLQQLVSEEIKHYQLERRALTSQGTYIYILLELDMVASEKKIEEPLYFIQVLDINERKLAEQLALERNDVLEMVVRGEPLPKVIAKLVDMVEHRRSGVYCAIMLVRDGRPYFTVAPSLFTNHPKALEHFLDEWSGNPNKVDEIAMTGTQWSAPVLSSNGQLLGVLAVYFEGKGSLTTSDFELFEMITRIAVIALEQRQMSDMLNYQAHHDALTGLPNRLMFNERLEQNIFFARRNNTRVGLFYIDLDRFKVVNDTLGHHVGDQLLIEVAHRLRSSVRRSDSLARMGGDEFTVVLGSLKAPQEAAYIAERIIESLDKPVRIGSHELHVTASIGISLYPEDSSDGEEMMRNADTAMYRAKATGMNNYVFYSNDMNTYSHERLDMENQLRGALGRNEFVLHFQPMINLKNRQLLGFEALIRWQYPKLGMVPPGKFIPIAEESGIIAGIGKWVLEEAARECHKWLDMGLGDLSVAVNISEFQFERYDFVSTIAAVLERWQLPAHCLKLEITESLLVRQPVEANRKLTQLFNLGVMVAIDDFGTGYSSLSYLQNLPVDILKIDRSFVNRITSADKEQNSQRALVNAVIVLAHSFGMKVAAEGVETDEQLYLLESNNCDIAQGYLFGKSMSASDVPAFVLLQKAESRR
ncbi:EAL domain-containing protein [Candidatus Chlorohelix sp.]|uniref:sensor domain-containing protein n=1 Tax=Candidatus Chlorohelix sp. TaxID=3139201 RepID=UPI0030636F4B